MESSEREDVARRRNGELAGLHQLDVTLLEVTNQHDTASGAEMSTRTNFVPSTTEVKNIIRLEQTLEIAGDQSQRIAPDELASLVGVAIIANSMNSTTNGTRISCARTGYVQGQDNAEQHREKLDATGWTWIQEHWVARSSSTCTLDGKVIGTSGLTSETTSCEIGEGAFQLRVQFHDL